MTSLERLQSLEAYLPISIDSPGAFLLACLVSYGFIAFRYFLIVGPLQYLFYRSPIQPLRQRQIYKKLPHEKSRFYEIRWSLVTSLVFAVAGAGITWLWEKGYTQIYLRFDEYPLWYLPLSFFLYLVLHDTYFYWTHRLMHHPKLYRKIHAVHHKSLEPSGWASFSFHPTESVIEALILPLLLLLVPIHPLVFLLHLTFMTLTAVSNHLGFELLPSWTRNWGLSKYFISATHHAQHHKFFNYNYGLYFSFWDRWLGTNHPDFDSEIQQRLGAKPQAGTAGSSRLQV